MQTSGGSGLNSRLDRLLHSRAQACLLVGTGIAVHGANLHSLVDLAESGVHAGLNHLLSVIAGLIAIAAAGGEAALHQGAQSRLVTAVAQAVALGNFDALLRRFVIGHRRTDAESANDDGNAWPALVAF